MKRYIIEIEVDEVKLRNSSIEPDDATEEEMIQQVVQMKLDDKKWLDDTGIVVKWVKENKSPPFIPGGFHRLKVNDVNWDDDDKTTEI